MEIFEPYSEHLADVTQGDLLQLFNSDSAAYGIVVTGECDIAQGKFSNIFSYVELLPAVDYAFRFIVLPALETLHDEIQENFLGRIRQSPDFAHVEPSIIQQMFFIDKAPPPIQEEALSLVYHSSGRALAEIEALINETSRFPAINERLSSIGSLAKKLNCRTKCPNAESLYNKIRSDPGDLFYVGRLPDQDDHHYITSLRVLREIHKNLVFTKPSALRAAPAGRLHAKRVARLTAPYRYRLTQKLAAVFSDIGLPGNFESHRADSLKALFQP